MTINIITADYYKSRFKLSVMLEMATTNSKEKVALLILSSFVALDQITLATSVNGFGFWLNDGERCLKGSGCGCINKKKEIKEMKKKKVIVAVFNILLFATFGLIIIACEAEQAAEVIEEEVIEEEVIEEEIIEEEVDEPLFKYIGNTRDELLAQFEENPSSKPIDKENVFFEEANLLFVFSNDLVDGIALFSGNEILGIELKNEDLKEEYIIEKLGPPEQIGEFQPRPNTSIKYLSYFYDVGGQVLRVDFFTYPEGVQPEFMVHVQIFGEDSYPTY